MQGNTQKIASPQRSRSIKLKVSNKIFPQDFFKRSSSQSPQKEPKQKENKNIRYNMEGSQKVLSPEHPLKNHQYWDIMRQQLQKCRNLSQKDKAKQIQRIWVYSQKKNRTKPIKEQKIRYQSRQQLRKPRLGSQLIQSPAKIDKVQLQQGLFTFFGKSPTKGFNLILPPIK